MSTANPQDRFTLMRYGKTQAEMEALFNKVAPPDNWKGPIDKTIECSEDEAFAIMSAVEYFAGGPCEVLPPKVPAPGQYRIKAPGYYMAIGA